MPERKNPPAPVSLEAAEIRVLLEKIKRLVEKDPRKAGEILTQWMRKTPRRAA